MMFLNRRGGLLCGFVYIGGRTMSGSARMRVHEEWILKHSPSRSSCDVVMNIEVKAIQLMIYQ
jgi:hypothetical protein